MYHGIILSGSRNEMAGRNIAGFRLRTAAAKFGYNILVIDSATAMTSAELESLLDSVITEKTLMLGISTVWLDNLTKNSIEWVTDDTIKKIKSKYTTLKIVAGGSTPGLRLSGAKHVYATCDWFLTGFSDNSFPKLLRLLEGHTDHGLKYMLDTYNKKVVDSNNFHQISHPDDIETIFQIEDAFHAHQPIPLEVSRGCIFRCAFCSHPFQGKKDFDSYIRTPENLASELRRNYELFGTTRYSIMDDTFNDSIEKLDRLEQAIELAKLPNFEFQAYIKPELLVTKPQMIDQLVRMGLRGGFCGIESFNNRARKVIGKGTDINKVLDALYRLCEIGPNVKLHGSVITGLPGDTKEDMYQWQEFFIKNQPVLFKSWVFQALGIFLNSKLKGESSIEKEPEKYGYKIIQKMPNEFALWYNEHMNFTEAGQLTKMLWSQSYPIMTPGGWHLSSAWNVGLSEDDISSKSFKDLELEQRGRDLVRQRAIETLKKFI
jgi:radical SAM superfamily enzyme YgiQ (UPF0313 family)